MKCKKNIIQDESGEKIYLSQEDKSYIVQYSDETVLDDKKTVKLKDLGLKFSSINSFFLDYLKTYNIPTGFKKIEDSCVYFHIHDRLPLTIRVYNIVDKRIAKIFYKKEGEYLTLPIFEYLFGNSKDNLIGESHLISMDICQIEELKTMKRICSKVNAVLKSYFERRNSFLAETKCVFGRDEERILLVGNFTPKSLKVLPVTAETKTINPYKIKSTEDFRDYTDFVLSLTKN